MFSSLRNKFILINISITSLVIIIAFSSIYIVFTRRAEDRPPMPDDISIMMSSDYRQIIINSLEHEKKAAAENLLITLVISGIAIEIVVVILSYYLAEESIKPIKKAYESQKVFIANASHEIKTPLAAISANLEAADIHGNKWIQNIEKETEKLTTLNQELLALAKSDLIEQSDQEETDIAKLIDEVLQSFEPKMYNLKVQKNFSEPSKAKINPNDYRQIVCILIDNAIKYCDKEVTIQLEKHRLILSNDGRIIPSSSGERIFERFYQEDKSSEGVGLGLSIAKSIAVRNKWKIYLQPNKKKTTFCLEY